VKAFIQVLKDDLLFYYRLVPLFDGIVLISSSGFCSDMKGTAPDVHQVDFLFGERAKIFSSKLKSHRKKGLPLRRKEIYRDV
jgi:hypothetical protein